VKADRVFLVHMLECAGRIVAYTEAGREAFLLDTKTQDAVVRNFEIIGEAAKRVSNATRHRFPGIPWGRIAGFRDVLIHQYEGVDQEQVWVRVEQDLPNPAEALRAAVDALGPQ
jgi:uncharacterized protein with HEPN domain